MCKILKNSTMFIFFPAGQKATYGSLLTQGHLYFRSWNELHAQITKSQIYPEPGFRQKTIPFDFPSPPPPLPARPPRQKFNTQIPELNQDLKSESHDGWIFEDDEFVNVTLVNIQYIDTKSRCSPKVIQN